MGQRILTLIVKELLAAWRDPRSRFILVGPPLIELVLFTYAATEDVTNVRMGVVNEDYGTAARDLVARFEGSPNFAEVRRLRGEADIAPAIDSRSVLMVLHIGPDFSRRLTAGESSQVQLILDGRRSNASQLVAGYAQAILDAYNQELAAGRRGPQPPSAAVTRIWFNPNREITWNSVPSLVVILTTVMGLVVTALSVARERELGTFEQLLVSPLQPLEIIVGKTVPAVLIGLGEATMIIGAGVVGFRVPMHGSLVLLYASMLVYLAAVIGVGLFISSLARTQQQAILGAFVFMVPAVTLSGFASPIENMPDWLQWVTLANPIRYFLVIVKGLFLKDLPAAEVLRNLWPLAVIAVVTLTASTWLFRHRTG
ncbi:MAG TPA: ABC transporter permease [Gemmataceae bacterium]|nr:ABC transporter permease [Gemmataceae bacterium]